MTILRKGGGHRVGPILALVSNDASGQKARLREWARAQPAPMAAESDSVVEGLALWLAAQPSSGVLVYSSMPAEIPVERVVDRLVDRHRFYLTRTPPAGPLTVHYFSTPREVHGFGYLQPVAGSPLAPYGEIDVVLVPGLCFDRMGDRIGWGKGYYDQLLSEMPSDVARVGVTLERLLVDDVPTEAHDQRMTHLATDDGVRRIELRSVEDL